MRKTHGAEGSDRKIDYSLSPLLAKQAEHLLLLRFLHFPSTHVPMIKKSDMHDYEWQKQDERPQENASFKPLSWHEKNKQCFSPSCLVYVPYSTWF